LLYDKYDEYVRQRIESAIRQTKAQVLIIDNITCMGSATHHAGGALPLMKTLKAIKTKHNLSMLVLAHTPKRNPGKPITVNDLQGSKMLINFADSAFALGQSARDPALRYLKQIKQRNTGSHYGAQNICLFRIGMQHTFLGFEFAGYDNEAAHLQRHNIPLGDETKQQIAELNRQGLSQRQIADHLKIGIGSVNRILARMREDAEV
jgi:DNA-binding CsgD family transcriptional regulator